MILPNDEENKPTLIYGKNFDGKTDDLFIIIKNEHGFLNEKKVVIEFVVYKNGRPLKYSKHDFSCDVEACIIKIVDGVWTIEESKIDQINNKITLLESVEDK